MLVKEFDALIRSWLPFDQAEKADSALNGLQVGRRDKDVRKAAFAVDASAETFRRAAGWGADLVFVHHGLFFGKTKPVTGALLGRIAFLAEHDIALYAVHLPLDMAPEIGNNAGLATRLGLVDREPFGMYHGVKIGLKGRLPVPRTLRELAGLLLGNPPLPAASLAFGPEIVSTAGVVSGGAPESARDAIDEGLDLFVTGEQSHEIYHESLEAGLNVIFAGHYASERFGVEAVGKKLAAETGLETVFIDVPTGL
ncbi:MAG: Nif3-like dinuclear metal center hexameric protein [Spirochaetales bacterium]|nr:Nif3-like dinuclear metal center hexameric protein [Spirochaetales bacterium]